MRRLLSVPLIVLLVGLLGFSVPEQAEAAAAKVVLRVAPSKVAVGEPIAARAKVTRAVRGQKARLQAQIGKKWQTVDVRKVTKKGASTVSFVGSFVERGSYRLRVVLAKKGKTKGAKSKVVTVRVTGAGYGGDDDDDDLGGVGGGGGVDPNPGSFRAIYAIASDQTATPDHEANIAAAAESVNAWFATQTTPAVRPRWQRRGGTIDVAVVRLPQTTAQFATMTFAQLSSAVSQAAGLSDHQKLVVFIDIPTGIRACGITGGDVSLIPEMACGGGIHPDASPFPGGVSYLLAHEMTHNFGAVASCAPHTDRSGHVNDDPRDLLYQGREPRDWYNLMLDPGHDDYYATSSPCADIQDSGFWEPAA